MDGKDSNSEIDDVLDNNLEKAELDFSGKEVDVNSAREDSDNDPQNQVQVSQDLTVKDGTIWLLPIYNMGACYSKTY